MMRMRTRRVNRVENAVDAMPFTNEALREAYDTFRMFGELPHYERLAQAVIESALVGRLLPVQEPMDEPAKIRMLLRQAVEEARTPPPERTLREYLLDHAGYAPPRLRAEAQLACRYLAGKGADLTDPHYLEDEPLPAHNSIGMRLLGYPNRLARPPYDEQARRLFARLDALRDRSPQDQAEWMKDYGTAVEAFHTMAELPEDELLLDAVLADAELIALFQHAAGDDVGEWMAALDRAATTTGAARDEAIDTVRALVLARLENP